MTLLLYSGNFHFLVLLAIHNKSRDASHPPVKEIPQAGGRFTVVLKLYSLSSNRDNK
ncbi:hypothetical protein J6590_020389 [Homalodisca vitripennis]|nr:hypothetical protein J6590_020389 [Homalodisca vitripennis]